MVLRPTYASLVHAAERMLCIGVAMRCRDQESAPLLNTRRLGAHESCTLSVITYAPGRRHRFVDGCTLEQRLCHHELRRWSSCCREGFCGKALKNARCALSTNNVIYCMFLRYIIGYTHSVSPSRPPNNTLNTRRQHPGTRAHQPHMHEPTARAASATRPLQPKPPLRTHPAGGRSRRTP
eukprot:scaffold81683_cov78-Phaeocystis_antarctica.AAC.1